MVKPNVVLHIGTEKTGTTSIQEFLYINQEALRKQGFYVPSTAGYKNHRKIPSYCMLDDNFDDFFYDLKIYDAEGKNNFRRAFIDEFTSEMASLDDSIHTVLISSEHFHSRTTSLDEIILVKKFLEKFFSKISIICYVREQAATCMSLYSTVIKAGQSPSFIEFMRGCNPDSIYYNYFDMLNRWSDVFGVQSIGLGIFDRQKFIRNDLIEDFMERVGIAPEYYISKDTATENESLNDLGQVIGRAANLAFPKYDSSGSINRTRKSIIDFISQELKGKARSASSDVLSDIYWMFNESNIDMAKKYLGNSENPFSIKPERVDNNFQVTEEHVLSISKVFGIISDNRAELRDGDADVLRDAAIFLENKNISIAYNLMKMASMIRPHGPLIQKKLSQYKERLDNLTP